MGTIVRDYSRQHILGMVAIIIIVLVINAGHYYRNLAQFGTPLGPQYGVASLDHSPGALLSTFLRNIVSNLTTPFYRPNETLVDSVVYVHRVLGLNADDPNTTYPQSHFNWISFPSLITSEDLAPNPLHLSLIILSLVIIFSKRLSFSGSSGLCGVIWVYSVTVLLGGILFCLMLRWQNGTSSGDTSKHQINAEIDFYRRSLFDFNCPTICVFESAPATLGTTVF
jgi:hypothetical protein